MLEKNKKGWTKTIKNLERFLTQDFLCKLLRFSDLSEFINTPMN